MYVYIIGFMFSRIATFFTILFTGKFPQGYFNFQKKVLQYSERVNATVLNLVDGYPSFSLSAEDPRVIYEPDYKEKVGAGRLLIRAFFGPFMLIPHIFILVFRIYGSMFVSMVAWFAVLFTGKYPENMFNFVVGTGRWSARINNFMIFYCDDYPPFTGKVVDGENVGMDSETQDHLVTD